VGTILDPDELVNLLGLMDYKKWVQI